MIINRWTKFGTTNYPPDLFKQPCKFLLLLPLLANVNNLSDGGFNYYSIQIALQDLIVFVSSVRKDCHQSRGISSQFSHISCLIIRQSNFGISFLVHLKDVVIG